MLPDNTLKALFLNHHQWEDYLALNMGNVRDTVIENVTKFLACGTSAFGSRRYHCDKLGCSHEKYLHQTCKSRACPSCGVKATERWIVQQTHILPNVEWQHITLTLPHTLWAVFQHNRWLLNDLFTCAAKIFLGWADAQDVDIGIFCALHTYGRRLNWNVHLHLSVTRGGLCKKQGVWKPVFFKAKPTEQCWRTAVIRLLHRHYARLKLRFEGAPFIRHETDWSRFLSSQYRRYWKVHFAKKTRHHKQTVNYLGRYLKRPPVAVSHLRHYSRGGQVTFTFLNHRTQKKESMVLTSLEMIGRLTEHIPEKHFKMLRYYGFLSNRKRGEMLPQVYAALKQPTPTVPEAPGYAAMLKGYVKVDPYACVLCSGRMAYTGFRSGSTVGELISQTKQQVSRRPA